MVIFFDLDDTLYERSVPFEEACLELNIGNGKEAFLTCVKRADEVFLDSQRGIITMEEMYIYRYKMGFADVGIELTDEQALEFQHVYSRMQKKIRLADGVANLLDFCKGRFDGIGIITNGPGQHQRDKIKLLGLDKWVNPELIVVSGDIGIDKPDLEIFEYARRKSGCAASDLIMVGDVYEKDIEPALKLGWKAVYLDKESKEPGRSGIYAVMEALLRYDD